MGRCYSESPLTAAYFDGFNQELSGLPFSVTSTGHSPPSFLIPLADTLPTLPSFGQLFFAFSQWIEFQPIVLGYHRFESCWEVFSLSHARDKLITTSSPFKSQ